MKDTKNLVFTALMCALCCITTIVIKLPTPTMGYIHPGDGLVLLSGLILEPLPGALAAGSGIPFNLVQGIFGILIAAVLYPVIVKLNANNVHNDCISLMTAYHL